VATRVIKKRRDGERREKRDTKLRTHVSPGSRFLPKIKNLKTKKQTIC